MTVGKSYTFRWCNDENNKKMYGRKCVVLEFLPPWARVRFDNGEEETVNYRALKKVNAYPWKWKTTMKMVLIRDKYTCQRYKRIKNDTDDKYTFQVHHIDGNRFNCTQENMITVCRDCHNKIHAEE